MIESPCIDVCIIDEDSERCQGCLRTLDEIANWALYTSDQRLAIMSKLDRRRQAEQGQDAAGDSMQLADPAKS